MRTRGRDLQGKAENTGVPSAAKAATVMRRAAGRSPILGGCKPEAQENTRLFKQNSRVFLRQRLRKNALTRPGMRR